MRKALALAAILLASLTLTGCGDTRTSSEKYEDCMQAYEDSGMDRSEDVMSPETVCYLSAYSD